MPDQGAPTIPVTLITGFLGAGKTSWLNARLRAGQVPADSLILVNDFGRLQVDADLIVARDDQVVRLANGCVCCSLSENLASQLSAATRRTPPPAAIYVEGSGIAHPLRLQEAVRLNARLHLQATVCLVDAQATTHWLAQTQVADLWWAQLRAASEVWLNRVPADGVPAALQRALSGLGAQVCVHRNTLANARETSASNTTPSEGPSLTQATAHAATASTPDSAYPAAASTAQPIERWARGTRLQRPATGAWATVSLDHAGHVDPAALHAVLAAHADVVQRAKGWLRQTPGAPTQVFQHAATRSQWLAHRQPQAQAQLLCIGVGGARFDAFVVAMQALGFEERLAVPTAASRRVA